jgi:hypothetical protein
VKHLRVEQLLDRSGGPLTRQHLRRRIRVGSPR